MHLDGDKVKYRKNRQNRNYWMIRPLVSHPSSGTKETASLEPEIGEPGEKDEVVQEANETEYFHDYTGLLPIEMEIVKAAQDFERSFAEKGHPNICYRPQELAKFMGWHVMDVRIWLEYMADSRMMCEHRTPDGLCYHVNNSMYLGHVMLLETHTHRNYKA